MARLARTIQNTAAISRKPVSAAPDGPHKAGQDIVVLVFNCIWTRKRGAFGLRPPRFTLQSPAMTYRPILIALAATLALSACTDADWSRTMHYIGVSEGSGAPAQARAMPARPMAARPMATGARTAAARPAEPPQVVQPGVNPFCASVAKQDSESNDFDAPTQQRVFVQSYQQCVRVFGKVTPE